MQEFESTDGAKLLDAKSFKSTKIRVYPKVNHMHYGMYRHSVDVNIKELFIQSNCLSFSHGPFSI